MAERLPTPLRDAVDAELDEADVPRLWRGVEARRLRRRAWRRATLAGAAAAAIGLAIVAGWWLRGEPPEASSGALTRVDGATVLGPLSPGARLELADASWVEPSPEAAVSVLSSGPSDFVLHLRAGAIEVQVTPGGPRRWVVEAGAATVEVVGTQFRVERDGARVRVSVSRGAVVVRHPTLEDGLRRLAAGEAIELGAPAVTAAEPPPAARPASLASGQPAPEATPTEPEPEPATPPRRGEPSWVALARGGDYDRAYAALGADGTHRPAAGASPAELMQLADVARYSGHPAEAVGPLERLLSHHPSDASAPLAAFVLGQIELDQLRRPRDASRHFARALSAGLPAALAGDARARLALAREQAGDRDGAREAACDYLTRHPEGSRASAMTRLCPDAEAAP